MIRIKRLFRGNLSKVALVIFFTIAAIYGLLELTLSIIEKENQKIRNMNRIHEVVDIDVPSWRRSLSTCDGHFVGFGHEFAVLQNVYVDPKMKTFKIPCERGFLGYLPSYEFSYGGEGTPLQRWYDSIKTYLPSKHIATKSKSIETVTFVVERIEAHNLYHTMCEWYNVFVVSKLLDLDPLLVDILLLDDRPPSPMDETWKTLYHKVWRRTDVGDNPLYDTLIWNVIGYESPINFHELVHLDYMEEFYRYFINAFDIAKVKERDCSNLTATIIWRRDYMTHPERKKISGGKLHRKFKNEDEILDTVRTVMKGHNVKDVILEGLSMKQQLDLIVQTDILIGMHGAALTHVLFLPGHAGVFEILPRYMKAFNHFKAFARWRGIKHMRWQNEDKNNEFDDYYTHIPPAVVKEHVSKLRHQMCP